MRKDTLKGRLGPVRRPMTPGIVKPAGEPLQPDATAGDHAIGPLHWAPSTARRPLGEALKDIGDRIRL